MGAWEFAIDTYLDWLIATGASPATIRLRHCYMRQFARSCPAGPWEVRTDDLVRFLARPGWSSETRQVARSTVRSFFRWAWTTDRIPKDPARPLPPVRVPRGLPRPAPGEVVAQALARADDRQRLMLLLALLAGLRRGEIARLRGDDVVSDEAGRLVLRIVGKGGRHRMVPLHPMLASLLPASPGPVFPGRISGHLSPQWVGITLTRLLGSGFSGHSLRHKFATAAYSHDHDLRAVQELLGHVSPLTTARYTQVDGDSLRAAVYSLTA